MPGSVGESVGSPKILVALGLFLGGCTSSLHSEVVIQAPPDRVWNALIDLDAYPEWNPFFVNAEGELVVGDSLEITMQPVGKEQQPFSPKVLALEPRRKLVWRGRLWIPWLFDGEHTFSLERIDAGSVRFIQHESFAGIFVPFVGFEPYHRGWELMNAALKRRAESPDVAAK